MDQMQGIYWHQGLFLQPQHFQQLERQQHHARQALARLAQPYPWGLERLDVAEAALANRMLEVRQLKLLMSDQTALEYPGNAVLQARSFEKHWPDTDQPLNVYLAVRRWSVASPNVTVIDKHDWLEQVRTRLVTQSNPGSMQDLYAQSSEALMPTVAHVVRLVFEDELSGMEDHDVMPLLQLARVGDQVRLVDGFVPPVVSIDASDFLLRLLRDTRDEMLGRCRQLEEYKSPKGMQAEDLDAQFLMMMQAVQVLNRQVPALTHLIETRGVHPWLVYGQLRQCVGELSTFSQRVDLLGRMVGKEESLPAYDHEAPAPCFVRACDVLLQILSEIAAGPELLVTLIWRDGWLQADIPHQYLVSRHRFYLILQSEDWSSFDLKAFLGSARLAATAQMAGLIDHALPGIELMPLSGPPQGLPRRSNARYFRIEQVSEGWAAVQAEGGVSLDWPEAPEGVRAVIAAIRG